MTKQTWFKHPPGRSSRLLAATIFGAIAWAAVPALAAEYHQSPMLDDLVKAGTLPPVDQRLPANPRVEETSVIVTRGPCASWQSAGSM